MPAKNSVKTYIDHSFYHVYNRGVEKRDIFQDAQDYRVFTYYLKEYLSPPALPFPSLGSDPLEGLTLFKSPVLHKNYTETIELHAFVLMPNHFHLLIRQINDQAMQSFLQSLCTRYSMYFNRRYERVGSLFQGRYKGVLVQNDAQLLHLSRYIHINPYYLRQERKQIQTYPYSSYRDYIGQGKTLWVKSDFIHSLLTGNIRASNQKEKSMLMYQKFVEDYTTANDNIIIESIAID